MTAGRRVIGIAGADAETSNTDSPTSAGGITVSVAAYTIDTLLLHVDAGRVAVLLVPLGTSNQKGENQCERKCSIHGGVDSINRAAT